MTGSKALRNDYCLGSRKKDLAKESGKHSNTQSRNFKNFIKIIKKNQILQRFLFEFQAKLCEYAKVQEAFHIGSKRDVIIKHTAKRSTKNFL